MTCGRSLSVTLKWPRLYCGLALLAYTCSDFDPEEEGKYSLKLAQRLVLASFSRQVLS